VKEEGKNKKEGGDFDAAHLTKRKRTKAQWQVSAQSRIWRIQINARGTAKKGVASTVKMDRSDKSDRGSQTFLDHDPPKEKSPIQKRKTNICHRGKDLAARRRGRWENLTPLYRWGEKKGKEIQEIKHQEIEHALERGHVGGGGKSQSTI